VGRWTLPDGTMLIGVHRESDCKGACVLHAPSDHHMRLWGLVWRGDRGIFERICPHGVGHPDPDQFAYWESRGEDEWQGVHGCDGCCTPPKGADE